ncbi:hypothetical protein VZO05_08245 [Aggregatilineales bacterium SYSU G02658]
MAEKLAVHIPPEANPTNITKLISYLCGIDEEFSSMAEILQLSGQENIGARQEMTQMAKLMGFIYEENGKIKASSLAYAFANLEPHVQADILHWLLYSGWSKFRPFYFLPSWAYQQICDHLWNLRIQEIDKSFPNQIVAEIIEKTEIEFSRLAANQHDGISFSRKSWLGAMRWLSALQPPVLADKTFKRRDFCEPALMLLAFNYALRDDPDALNINILLSEELREQLCRVCLLDPIYFDQTLDWMLPLYPHIISSDPDVGYYGRYVRLQKLPTIEDLVK